MIGQWYSKPTRGTLLDRSHPLARGLIGFFPLWEGGGSVIADAVGQVVLTPSSAATWGASPRGSAFVLGSSGAYAQTGTLPASWQVPYPITLVVAVRMLATPSSTAECVAYFHEGPTTALSGISITSSPQWLYSYANGSSSANVSTGLTPSSGVDYVAGLTLTTASQSFYLNGSLAYSGSASASSPTYSSPILDLGYNSSLSTRTPNLQVYWVGAWGRALSASEHATIGWNPAGIWRLFRPLNARAVYQSASARVPYWHLFRGANTSLMDTP